jgi:NAD(P)-dependent dehydrogenase (short-subunit alcohol dehydrogenase family)
MESLDFFKNEKGFAGKNVVVTGATGGIGSLVVECLVSLGAKVVAVARSEKKVFDKLARVVKRDNFDYEIINLENPIVINRGFKSIMAKVRGKLDILILCHAVFKVGRLMETSIDVFDMTLNLNVRSCFHLISLATPFLKYTGGNIVAVSSVESMIPVRDSFLNSVSKVTLIIPYLI